MGLAIILVMTSPHRLSHFFTLAPSIIVWRLIRIPPWDSDSLRLSARVLLHLLFAFSSRRLITVLKVHRDGLLLVMVHGFVIVVPILCWLLIVVVVASLIMLTVVVALHIERRVTLLWLSFFWLFLRFLLGFVITDSASGTYYCPIVGSQTKSFYVTPTNGFPRSLPSFCASRLWLTFGRGLIHRPSR